MLTIQSVTVRSWHPTYMDVCWTIGDTNEDIAEYSFDVYRCEAQYGEYTRLTARGLINRFIFRDIQPPTQNMDRKLWYKVRLTHLPSGQYTESIPACHRGDPAHRITRMVQTHSMQLFRAITGRPCFLYPVRTFGQKCPACTSDLTGITNTQNCATCYDTAYAGGFHPPVLFLAQIDESESAMQLSDQNQGQVYTHNLRTPTADPEINPNDIIVDKTNRRFRVVKVSSTTTLGVPSHFECAMIRLPVSDIIYNIPLFPEEDMLRSSAMLMADTQSDEDRIDGLPDLLYEFTT